MTTNTADFDTFANNIIPNEDLTWDWKLAHDLGILDGNLTVEESVGGTDQRDLYKITIDEAGEYTFNLDGLTGNADLAIFDANGQMVNYSALTGTKSESLSLNLNTGIYYVGVTSADSSLSDYNLHLSNGDGGIADGENHTLAQDPGDGDLADAYDLRTIEGNLTVKGSVGGTDQGDLYKITIDEAGEYTFNLEDLSANADLYLFDPNDERSDGTIPPFERSESSGTQSEEIAVDLDVGTYYVRVKSTDSNLTDYNLNISDRKTITPELDPGNGNLAYAYDLGTIDGNSTVEESVGGNDQGDLYKITINEAGKYTFNVNELSANANLYLYDPNDEVSDGTIPPFERSESSGTQSEEIAVDLDVGTYYARVASADGKLTDYNLDISDDTNKGQIIFPSIDPGYDTDSAYDLGTIEGSLTVEESIGGNDQNDGYQITINEAGKYTFNLEDLSANADLYLLDPNDERSDGSIPPFERSELSGTQSEEIAVDLDVGTYYVGVVSADSNLTDYSLNISDDDIDPNPNNDPGETFDTAKNMGYFGGMISISYSTTGSVGNSDPIDFYEFTIGATRELDIGLDGLTANADLRVYDSSSQLLGASENYNSQAENLSGTLSAGTYYIEVFSDDGVETNYNLTLEL